MRNNFKKYSKNKVLSLFFIILLMNFNFSYAASFKAGKKNTLYISGKLEFGDEKLFLEALKRNSDISDIIFEDCMGGALQAGFHISQEIKRRKLNTIASNQCHSACSYAFLAGKTRKFDESNGKHILSLHATTATNGTFEEQEERNRALMRYLSFLTDNKLTEKVKTLIFDSRGTTQVVVFIARNHFFKATDFETRYCNGAEKLDTDKCKKIDNADATMLGIIN